MLLSDLLPEIAERFPEAPAYKQGTDTVTYRTLLERTTRLAFAFNRQGLKPGDRLALVAHPGPNLAAAEFAAIALGVIPFAVFPGLSQNEINHILTDAEPAAMVYDVTMLDHLDKETGTTSHADLRYGQPGKRAAGDMLLQDMYSHGPMLPPSAWHRGNCTDPALLIYTGGTTGRPKGVIHTHHSVVNWFNVYPPAGLGHAPHQKSIGFNMAHLTGQGVLWMTLAAGGCVHFLERYPAEARNIIELVEQERITHLGTVGGMLRAIVAQLETERRTLPSLRVVTCGGMPIHPDTLQRASGLFPTAAVLNVYSQTESGMMISMLPVSPNVSKETLYSVGCPAAMAQLGQKPFEIRIVDGRGEEVSEGQTGEIVVRAEAMMQGYWRNPAETALVLRNGWLHTGDVGRLDEAGYLFVIERRKDVVIVNGSNVYSAEVERQLESHPSVNEAAVFGISQAIEGEAVAAVVTLVAGERLDPVELRQFLKPRLAGFKHPSKVMIAPSLPRTVVGKVDKIALELWLQNPSQGTEVW